MITITEAQWSLVHLLISGVTRGLKLALKAAENIKNVRMMTPEQVDDAITKEEGRSKKLQKELDAS